MSAGQTDENVATAPQKNQAPLGDKRMKLRYAGNCRLCGVELPAKAYAIYERDTKTVRYVVCPSAVVQEPTQEPEAEVIVVPELVAAPVDVTVEVVVTQPEPEQVPVVEVVDDSGVAGSSARREYERRKAKEEARIREKWGRFGGLAVALSDEKQSTKAWAIGAVGEEKLGARLDGLVGEHIAVLHDRRIPKSRANIDHIVITRGGVWVIDAKRYKGRPRLVVEGGILRPRVEKVYVGSRDGTPLVDGVIKQVGLVRDVVPEVRVNGVLCFVEADWPLFGGSFTSRGVIALSPKKLAAMLREDEGTIDVAATRQVVAGVFRAT